MSLFSDAKGHCNSGDDWQPSCIGWCKCSGYMTGAAEASAVLVGSGLLLSAMLLKETKDTHLEAEVKACFVDLVELAMST